MNFHCAGFQGDDATGDRTLLELGFEAADAMVTRSNYGYDTGHLFLSPDQSSVV